jgi:hypothetical protein
VNRDRREPPQEHSRKLSLYAAPTFHKGGIA